MRYSRWEIDEYVEQTQLARARERSESAEWHLEEDEWSDVFGPVMRKKREEGDNRMRTREQMRQESIARGNRFSEWGGMTGLRCNYCGMFLIDQAHEFDAVASARAEFKRQHEECTAPSLRPGAM